MPVLPVYRCGGSSTLCTIGKLVCAAAVENAKTAASQPKRKPGGKGDCMGETLKFAFCKVEQFRLSPREGIRYSCRYESSSPQSKSRQDPGG